MPLGICGYREDARMDKSGSDAYTLLVVWPDSSNSHGDMSLAPRSRRRCMFGFESGIRPHPVIGDPELMSPHLRQKPAFFQLTWRQRERFSTAEGLKVGTCQGGK